MRMPELLLRISTNCIGWSYLLAFALELARIRWQRPWLRWGVLASGAAGLFAHSAFLAAHYPSPATAYGATLGVAWVLSIFFLVGAIHHNRQAWGAFVLPIILALIGLAFLAVSPSDPPAFALPEWLAGDRIWGAIHGAFVLMAAVGISVGGVSSAMYLLQAARLRSKRPPLGGLKLLSLERLERMNRRALALAFPLLTVGLLLGALLLRQTHDFAEHWFEPKVLGTLLLWLVFAVLVYLRYGTNVPPRRLAMLTLASFALVLIVLFAAHPFATTTPSEVRP